MKAAPFALTLLLVAGALFGGYQAGKRSATNAPAQSGSCN
jgi:hypothetical protein